MGRPITSVCILLLLQGCSSTQSNATSELSTEQRIAALQSVRDQVAGAQGKDPAAAAESLVTYLRGRAEFAEAGIRQGSVWAVLHDGRQLVIPAEAFAPLPTASSPSRAPAPRSTAETEIPEGKAVLVNTTGVQIEGSEFGALSVDLRGMKYTLFPTTGDYWRIDNVSRTGGMANVASPSRPIRS